MEFHEKLQTLAAKEGLKGRKVTRALESFSWNITILKVSNTHTYQKTPNSLRGRPIEHALPLARCLFIFFALFSFLPSVPICPSYPVHFLSQGQADLLKHAKAEVQENMKQVHDAALTGNLTKESLGVRRVRSQTRRGQDDKPATIARGPSATRANDQQTKEDAAKLPS